MMHVSHLKEGNVENGKNLGINWQLKLMRQWSNVMKNFVRAKEVSGELNIPATSPKVCSYC